MSSVINGDLRPQIHNRYEGKDISKHKRNLVIAGGVTLSVIVSPVVAAVTVGKKGLFLLSPSLSPSVSHQHLNNLKRISSVARTDSSGLWKWAQNMSESILVCLPAILKIMLCMCVL